MKVGASHKPPCHVRRGVFKTTACGAHEREASASVAVRRVELEEVEEDLGQTGFGVKRDHSSRKTQKHSSTNAEVSRAISLELVHKFMYFANKEP